MNEMNVSNESRLVKLVGEVFCRSFESDYVEPTLTGDEVEVVMKTLQLLDEISAPSAFVEAMKKLDAKLDSNERESIGEITIRDIVKFKVTCSKIFDVLIVKLQEESEKYLELFNTQLMIAVVLWTMSELDTEVESFILECENHIQFIENDDGSDVEIVILNNQDPEEEATVG